MISHAQVATVTSSSVITTKPAILLGMQIGTDGANDPTVTVYDGTSSSGSIILPTTTYDATALGMNGPPMTYPKSAYNGIYVAISIGGGSVNVTIDYKELS